MSKLIGKTVGQYKIVSRIGVGGMATVFKAYQAAMDRHVALKILPFQLAQDPILVKRFQREAQAVASLEHPHIVPVYDFGTQDELTYLVMRYVEGGTLTKLMLSHPLPDERIIQIIGSVARALGYAHQQGIVHRDIKPSNILIDDHGESLLTDFGVAKLIREDQVTATPLTGSGKIVGTPDYISPEQAAGAMIDGRSDIYSLGVILYELLTGQTPYQATTPLGLVMKHVNEPLQPPRKINPDVNESLEQIVLKAMQKSPQERYQSADEMYQALQDVLLTLKRGTQSNPSSALSSSPEEDKKTPAALFLPDTLLPNTVGSSQNRPLLVGSIVLGLLLCIAVGGVTFFSLNNGGEKPVAENPENSGQASEYPALPSSQITDLTQNPPSALDGQILFREEFNSNQNVWYVGQFGDESEQATAQIIEGYYRLSQQDSSPTAWWTTPQLGPLVDNFILSVEVKPISQKIELPEPLFGYGLVFRYVDDQNFYVFIANQQEFAVLLLLDDEWRVFHDYQATDLIQPDQFNHLAVKAIGPEMTFFINGQEVAAVEDDHLPYGSAGLIIENYAPDSEGMVEFDNFILREVVQDKILLTDYFETNENGWPTGEFEEQFSRYEATLEEGDYTLQVTSLSEEEFYIERLLPNHQFSDFILKVEATPHDSAEHYSYGLVFRANKESGQAYNFEIGNDGLYTILLADEENLQQLRDWSSSEAIRAGESNTLTVIANGEKLIFLINQESVATITDATVREGAIGVFVELFEKNKTGTVSFDNLVIEKIGP